MKIILFSNFINHHQLPLAHAFREIPGVEYTFVATTPFNAAERQAMGYKDENNAHDFVLRAYESKEAEQKAHALAKTGDIVIVGSAPDQYMAERLALGKVTFHTSERYFKKGLNWKTFPRYFASALKHIYPYQHQPLYYLCSSAYTAVDVNTFASFPDRCFKWAYFTEVKPFDLQLLFKKKKENKKPIILWAGRFLDWKHPDAAVRTAAYLKKRGYSFEMNLIGGGTMQHQLEDLISQFELQDTVKLLGFAPPQQVRQHMEQADIFLFTSDFNEGWGAVLNEAMSSGCAVVASHACGSTPFLVKNGVNGFIYQYGQENQLFTATEKLLTLAELRTQFGTRAYQDMDHLWNAHVAANRLIQLHQAIQEGTASTLYQDGPCSLAPSIPQKEMYEYIVHNR